MLFLLHNSVILNWTIFMEICGCFKQNSVPIGIFPFAPAEQNIGDI